MASLSREPFATSLQQRWRQRVCIEQGSGSAGPIWRPRVRQSGDWSLCSNELVARAWLGTIDVLRSHEVPFGRSPHFAAINNQMRSRRSDHRAGGCCRCEGGQLTGGRGTLAVDKYGGLCKEGMKMILLNVLEGRPACRLFMVQTENDNARRVRRNT